MMLVRDRVDDADGNGDDDEVAEQQECDACPHCNDTCLSPLCDSCQEKRRIMNEREHDQQSCSLLPKTQSTTTSTKSFIPSAPSSFNVVSNQQQRIRKRYYTMCEVSRHDGTTSSNNDNNNNAGAGAAVLPTGSSSSPSSTSRTPPSLWIVAGNKVYDVTEYIQYHPGGSHCFYGRRAGGHQDSLRDLQYHSKLGQRLWGKFHIGYVTKCFSSTKQRPDNITKQTISTRNDKDTSSSMLLQQPKQWNFQFPSLW